jgi:hypothetical protein
VGIKEVIETINRMQADGVIERYAIGGAVGATFYLEPVATLDVDIFIEFHAEPGSRLVSLEPILKYLRDHGCIMEGQHIVIAGWPVQFLPAGTPLLQEALEKAIERDLDGTPTRVFTAEHIAAIALETGGQKIKHACFNSSRPMRSIWTGCKKSSGAMVWLVFGSNSSNNS